LQQLPIRTYVHGLRLIYLIGKLVHQGAFIQFIFFLHCRGAKP
jgi:hypothetical protein